MIDLKKTIKRYGVTQSFLAVRWGVYQSAVSQMLGGGKMSLEKLYDLADACGCTVSELLSEDNASPSCTLTCPHCGKPIKVELGKGE
ncbi:MAG: helix-turn-helix transcriptional regulator [Prevotella sp.]|nr:helix-turn-helix transcriptional regulator [Candidatus Prevotella equi]